MKTFNSTLAIVAIAISSVFGFTSCEKDNEAFSTPTSGPHKIVGSSTTTGNGTYYINTTTITTENGTYTSTTSNGTVNDTSNMLKLTTKDVAGTYKCTAEDGKEWMIVLTENACSAEGHYSASITVPEGAPVAAKTYEGEYQIGVSVARFFSNEKAENTTKSSVVSFGMTVSKHNTQNATVTLKFTGKLGEKLEFVKQ